MRSAWSRSTTVIACCSSGSTATPSADTRGRSPRAACPIGRDPLEGAQRELAEETGVRASTWREITRFSLANSTSDETGALYLATGLTRGDADPDETEELQVRWMAFAEAVEAVRTGELFDAMTQIGLLRIALDRSQGRLRQ